MEPSVPVRVRRRADGEWLLLLSAVGGLLAGALATPGHEALHLFGWEVPVLCPYRAITGEPCWGCGSTRSVVAFLHGDLEAAWAAHPAGPLVAVGAAVVVVWLGLRRWRAFRLAAGGADR